MSMPSTVLRCDSCENQTNTFILYHDFKYIYNNIQISASGSLGYCCNCECLSVIENFDDIDYSLEQIAAYSDDAIQQAKKPLSLNMTQKAADRKVSAIRELRSYAYLFAISLKRKGDERCLACLSKNIVKFDGDMTLPYSDGYFSGTKRTGFKHPGCGGEYIVSGSEARFILKRQTSYYKVSENWQISKVDT